jgi:hypothetical protein
MHHLANSFLDEVIDWIDYLSLANFLQIFVHGRSTTRGHSRSRFVFISIFSKQGFNGSSLCSYKK